MGRKLRRCVAVLMLASALLGLLPAALAGEGRTVVRVAFPETPGLCEVYEDGSYGGVFYDWLVEISKYTGWEYEFVTGEASELMERMTGGELDLMGGMFYFESLEEEYSYPHYSVGSSNSLLIKRIDDERIQAFDLSTLNGKTIGAFQNAVNKIAQMEYFLAYNSVNCEIRRFHDPEEMNAALDSGEIDLMLGGDSSLTEGRSAVAQLGGEPYYIVSRADAPELYRELDQAITNIYMADPNFAAEVHAAYFPTYYDHPIVLTEADKAYIAGAEPVRVALVGERYPLSYTDKGSARKGVCLEAFEIIAEQTGLRFEFLYADNYQGMLDMVVSGEADVAGSFLDSERVAQGYGMMLTKAFVSLDNVILKNKSVAYPAQGLTVAVVEGRGVPEGVKPGEVRYYPTVAECLDAVESGAADVAFVPSAFVEELFYHNYYTQVTIVANNGANSNVSIALPRSDDATLFSILNKAVNSIPGGEMDSILSRNMAPIGERAVTLKSLLYANPVAFILVVCSFLALVFLLILAYARFKMKSQVMHVKLQKAEESVQVKSEFLSQMSHEIRTPLNAIIGLTQIALRTKGMPAGLERQLEQVESSSQFLLSLVNDILDMSKLESSKMGLNPAPFQPCVLMEQAESLMRVQAETRNVSIESHSLVRDEWFQGDAMRIKQVLVNLLSNGLKFTPPGGKVVLTLVETERDEAGAELRFSVQDTGVGIEKQDMERIFRSFEQTDAAKKVSQGTGLGLAISSDLVRLMGGELRVSSTPGKGSEFYFSLILPVCGPPQADAPQAAVRDLAGLRVLLAEDNDLNAEMVTFLLEDQGVVVERAADGQEAVDRFAKSAAGYYDLILMDVQMPVKSGLAATEEIRAMDRADAGTVSIFAMTANTYQEDRDKAAQAGMDGFIAKPFQVEQLYQILGACRQ